MSLSRLLYNHVNSEMGQIDALCWVPTLLFDTDRVLGNKQFSKKGMHCRNIKNVDNLCHVL